MVERDETEQTVPVVGVFLGGEEIEFFRNAFGEQGSDDVPRDLDPSRCAANVDPVQQLRITILHAGHGPSISFLILGVDHAEMNIVTIDNPQRFRQPTRRTGYKIQPLMRPFTHIQKGQQPLLFRKVLHQFVLINTSYTQEANHTTTLIRQTKIECIVRTPFHILRKRFPKRSSSSRRRRRRSGGSVVLVCFDEDGYSSQ
mmetsp:Transcript_10140/g.16983  ORF Transcript_10140/g.16983 Transcript_10140/m.16983 type:complete len:200 (+) Transcript_10140:192-791(+)